MQRIALALSTTVAFFVLTTSARGATITIVPDQPYYTVDDTITLTFLANAEGAIAAYPPSGGDQAFVIVHYDGELVTGLGGSSGTFTQGDGTTPALVGGAQGRCEWALGRNDQCLVYDQVMEVTNSPVDDAVVAGVFTFSADAVGVATFYFQDAVGTDFMFPDLGNATDVGTAPPGISVTIVPEPGTAALLGVGLAGLSGQRRLRRRAIRCRVGASSGGRVVQRAIRAALGILAVVSFAAPGAAATISMDATVDPAIPGDPGPGDAITLTVTAVIEEGDIAPGDQLRVFVKHDLSILQANGGTTMGTLTQLDGAAPAISSAFEGLCSTFAIGREDQCVVFDKIVTLSGTPVDAAVLTAVLTYTYIGAGTASFSFQDATGPDFIFFDLGDEIDVGTAPAGVTVPEPATAVLLGLGLAGLARRGRAQWIAKTRAA